MKLQVISLCIALMTALLTVPAGAQTLPDSVTEAYARYQQAYDAGDAETALSAARDALEAGEAEQIDAATLGVLAENYAALAAAMDRLDIAIQAFTRAGELYRQTGQPGFAAVRMERRAVETLFLSGEQEEASRRADTLADALEALPEEPERDFEIARTRALQAHASWNSGGNMVAGQRGREAFEAWRRSGQDLNADSAFLAFYAGIERAFRGDDRDAAFWFEVANQLFEAFEVADRASDIARAWGHYSRGRLSDTDRRVLLERFAEGGWVAEPCLAECDNADDAGDETIEDENNRDARPLRRPSPSYPSRMESARVQGITLVQFDIDEHGRTQDIEVLFSAPHPDFGESAVRSVERWRYEPKLVDGSPVVREDVMTEFTFALRN
ncbi:TonB family protein [Maricaulaceae bacterium MS644]